MQQCFERCLGALDNPKKMQLFEYYTWEQGQKSEHHQSMARAAGLTVNALRKRMFDLRQQVRDCTERCLGRGPFFIPSTAAEQKER